MNKHSRTVPIVLYTEDEQLLSQYRAALEQLDGKGKYAHFTDADLIAIASRVAMRQAIESAHAEGLPQ